MNKTELIDELASRGDITKTAAETALNTLTEVITSALDAGEEVKITGFGTFKPKDVKAGTRNAFGVVVKVKARRGVKFAAGKTLLDSLNG